MNPADLLNRLEAEGIGAALNLKVTADRKPSDETRALIQENRDTLLEYLAGKFVAANVRGETHLTGAANVSEPIQTDAPDMTHGSNFHVDGNFQRAGTLRNTATLPTSENTGVTLYGDLLHSLMVWVHRYHELRLEHPGGVIPEASPEQAAHHLQTSAWCVLYDETKTILATSGTVPSRVLKDKTELQTTEPIQAALNAVRHTREKVMN